MLDRFKQMLKMRSKREQVYARPEYWKWKAETYKGTAVSMFPNRTLNEYCQREQFSFYERALSPTAGRSIIDVGCGTGRLSRFLASMGASVTGIDFTQAALDLAISESTGANIQYRQGSIFNIDEEAAYDDAVTSSCLTLACTSKEQFMTALQQIHTCLKPGGRLAMIEPFHRGFLHRVLDLSPRDAVKMLESAGFDVLERKEMLFWPTRLLLTFGDTPAWITRPVYAIGELVRRIVPLPGLGDYTCILAKRRT